MILLIIAAIFWLIMGYGLAKIMDYGHRVVKHEWAVIIVFWPAVLIILAGGLERTYRPEDQKRPKL